MVRGRQESRDPGLLSCEPGCSGSRAPQLAVLMLCAAGTLQPLVVMPGIEATLFRMEGVDDSEALVDGDMVGIGRVFQLLVKDVVEEVEVVVDEEWQ